MRLFLLCLIALVGSIHSSDSIDLHGGAAFLPASQEYDDIVGVVWNQNALTKNRPRELFVCPNEDCVVSVITHAREQGVALTVLGRGHNPGGYAVYGEIALHYTNSSIVIDSGNMTATIEAGATLSELYEEVELITPSFLPVVGDCPGVGVVGYLLGGGISILSRNHGLGSDNVISARVVTPKGLTTVVDDQNHADLFWAIRGGGGSFGIVTQVTIRLRPVHPETAYVVALLHSNISLQALPLASSLDVRAAVTTVIGNDGATSTIVWNGRIDEGVSELRSFINEILVRGGEVLGNQTVPWKDAVIASTRKRGEPGNPLDYVFVKSGFIDTLNEDITEIIVRHMTHPKPFVAWAGLEQLGGTFNNITRTSSAFYHRNASFCLSTYALTNEALGQQDAAQSWLRKFYDELNPHLRGAYVNYADPSLLNWAEKYWGDNYPRLQSIRAKVDPYGVINFPQAVVPASGGEGKYSESDSRQSGESSVVVVVILGVLLVIFVSSAVFCTAVRLSTILGRLGRTARKTPRRQLDE